MAGYAETLERIAREAAERTRQLNEAAQAQQWATQAPPTQPPPQATLYPAAPPPPQPQVVDRVAYLQEQRNRAAQAMQAIQPLQEAIETYSEYGRLARERGGYEPGSYANPATEAYARTQFEQGVPREYGGLDPINLGADAARLAGRGIAEGAGLAKDALAVVPSPYQPAPNRYGTTDADVRPLSEDVYRAARQEIPGMGRVREGGRELLQPVVGDTAANIIASTVIPVEVWEAALVAVPIAKAKTITELASAIALGDEGAIRALRNAGARLGKSEAVERGLKKLASETGAHAPLNPLGTTGSVPSPSGPVPNAGQVTPATAQALPASPYIDPPEVPSLARDFPNEIPKDRPVVARDLAQTQSTGGAVRTIGNTVAEKVDDILTLRGDKPVSPATRILRWFSSEATRFRNSPLNEGVNQYKRAVAAGDTWAVETGNQMGQDITRAFHGKPNAVYIAADGQPVFIKAQDGTNIKLLNRDAVENVHVPAVRSRMTPEQIAAAEGAASMLQRLRNEARASGARIGAARAVDGSEVGSYVHRTAIAKDDARFLEYGDPVKPGSKLHTENARDYVTAAEGVKDGVRYADSWQEEYVSHLRALRRHEANASLKQWTDGLSETLSERIARLDPAAAGAKEAARDAVKVARQKLALRQREIAMRMRREAETAVRQARKRVSIAQRQLDRATSAGNLDRVEIRTPDAMKIGEARERLAAAIKAGNQREIANAQRRLDGLTTQAALRTQVLPRDQLIQSVGKAREELAAAVRDLKDASGDTIDALYRRMDDADRAAILTARADLEAAKGANLVAGKAYNAARRLAEEGLGRTVFKAPGGQQLPITAGRYFEPDDARVLQELAQEVAQHGKDTHPLIAAMRLGVQPLNFVTLTMDNSLFGVQGWLTLWNRPDAWIKTLVQSPLVAAMPRFRHRWLKAHEEGVRFIQKYAPHAFDANPDFVARGSLGADVIEGARIWKLNPLKYANQLFQDSRTMMAVYLAEAFKGTANNEQELFDLGSAIGKLIGVSRTVGGEKDMLLAAAFFRSKIGLGLDALLNGGIQGDMARKTFMKLVGGAAMVTLAHRLYQGERDPQALLDSITPGKDDAFEIGGINLLGTFAVEANLIGDMIANPSKATDNFGFFGQGKLNILSQKILAGYNQEDILGRPTTWQEQFASPLGLLPLSAQQYREWQLRGAPPEIAIPAAIFGAKYNPPSNYEQLADALKERGIEPDVFFNERGTRTQAMQDFPELKELYRQWEASRRRGTIEQRQNQKIVDDSRSRINAKIAEIITGKAKPEDLREFTQLEGATRRATYDALIPEESGGKDTRLDPLYDLYDKYTNPETGELDFDGFNSEVESILRANPELRPIWEAQQYIPYTDNPVEALLKDGQRYVATTSIPYGKDQSVTWFSAEDALWQDIKTASPELEKYATYGDYKRAMDLAALDIGVDTGVLANKDRIQGVMSDGVRRLRQGMLAQDPLLGAQLRVWYGVDLPDSDLPPALQAEIARRTKELIDAIYSAE